MITVLDVLPSPLCLDLYVWPRCYDGNSLSCADTAVLKTSVE